MAKMNQKSRRAPSKPLPPPPFLTFEWQTPSLSPFSPRADTSFQTINQFFSFYLLSFIPLPSPPPYSQFRTAKHLGGNLILTSLGRMKGKERKKRLMITPLHLLFFFLFSTSLFNSSKFVLWLWMRMPVDEQALAGCANDSPPRGERRGGRSAAGVALSLGFQNCLFSYKWQVGRFLSPFLSIVRVIVWHDRI